MNRFPYLASLRPPACRRTRRARCAAFTLVEVLIIIAVIIILLSLLVVALNIATRTAQKANTQSLLTAIKGGLVRFKEDIGYYPPVLSDGRDFPATWRRLVQGPSVDLPPAEYRDEIQEWYSTTTLAEYLIGYGDHTQDGYGVVPLESRSAFDWDQETPAVGFRHPGRDGVWGAGVDGDVSLRMGGPSYGSEITPGNIDQGKVFGPYIELDSNRVLASRSPVDRKLHFPGEVGYDAADPKVIVDYWGEPIVYFRRNYPPGALKQSYRAIDRDGDGRIDAVPTLGDVIRLRPFKLEPGTGVDSRFDDDTNPGDSTSTTELATGEFALFSAGPDRAFEARVRVDAPGYNGNPDDGDELNRDNLVEVGP